MERFDCKTAVVSGDGALSVLGERNCRRLLVVTDRFSPEDGQTKELIRAAGSPEADYLQAAGVEPTVKQAVEGSQRIREFQPDLVAALGGRTAVDLAKAMVCFSRTGCFLAAVPAGFGSGCEVTGQVTLTHNGHHHLLQDRAMRPELAVLDSRLVRDLPFAGVSQGGFELLSAALEAYTASGGGLLQDIHAREAFASAWAALPAACSGNPAARSRMQMASVLAGMAREQTGLGLCRAMENSLGMVFGLSRGNAAAIVLPAIIGCNAHAAGKRYAELSRAAGLGGSREEIGIRNLRAGLVRLRRELGLPGTLVQAGVDIRSIWNNTRRIVELTLEDPECRNNPVAVDDFMVRRIMEAITGRI